MARKTIKISTIQKNILVAQVYIELISEYKKLKEKLIGEVRLEIKSETNNINKVIKSTKYFKDIDLRISDYEIEETFNTERKIEKPKSNDIMNILEMILFEANNSEEEVKVENLINKIKRKDKMKQISISTRDLRVAYTIDEKTADEIATDLSVIYGVTITGDDVTSLIRKRNSTKNIRRTPKNWEFVNPDINIGDLQEEIPTANAMEARYETTIIEYK